MTAQSFYLHTLGYPSLVDPDGAEVPLSAKQLAMVIMLRLMKPDPAKLPSEYLKAVGWQFKRQSKDPGGIVHAHLTRIRPHLPKSIRHGKTVDWIRGLPCDAEILRTLSNEPDARAVGLLRRYRPFLEGFEARVGAAGFDRFVQQMSPLYNHAMRKLWASEVHRAAEAEDWETLLMLGRKGLEVDPCWVDAYLELHCACCRTRPALPLVSIEHARVLVAHLSETQRHRHKEILAAVHEAQALHAGMEPGAAPRIAAQIETGGELLLSFARSASSGSVACDPAHRGDAKDIDVFLAVPHASLGERFSAIRPRILDILQKLRQLPGCETVHYAGEGLRTSRRSEDEGIALRDCYNQLRRSRFFVMIYPEEAVSSVILEAGIALSLGIPGVIFHTERNHLPFLLRNVTKAFPTMHMCRFSSVPDLLNLLEGEVAARLRPKH